MKNKLTEIQKIALFMSGAAVVILVMAACKNWSIDWFSLLRWVVCLAFVGKLLEKFPAWFKFILIIGVIVYNPIFRVYPLVWKHWFESKYLYDEYHNIHWIAVVTLIAAEVVTIRRALKNGTPKNS